MTSDPDLAEAIDELGLRVAALETQRWQTAVQREQDRNHQDLKFAEIDSRIAVEMAKIRTALWVVGVAWSVIVALVGVALKFI